ncbi:MAG TPA: DoxX family protein [Terriglobia bacterium]|nr:DoxX family protein [Terriglobia bacterium]
MNRVQELIHFPYFQGWGIAIVRIVTGIVFCVHGAQKFFVDGLATFAGFLSQYGIPAPHLFSPVVAAVELLGGLALIVGVFTRWAAIPLAINMLVAGAIVHLPNGFFLPAGYEYTLVLLAASVSLFLAGSGAFALDNILFRRTAKPTASHEPVMA